MIKICICESDMEQLEVIKRIVCKKVLIEEYDMKIEIATQDPHELLKRAKDNVIMGVYFLDFELKSSMSGIELATEIRRFDSRAFIIFITKHIELCYFAFQFKLEILDFIIKCNTSLMEKSINECLVSVRDKSSTKDATFLNKVFVFKNGDKVISEPFENILYFEKSEKSHKVNMYAANRTMELYDSIVNLEDRLDRRFYKCRASCIINKDYIKVVDRKRHIIILDNGKECKASVRMIKGLKEF